MCFLQWFKNSMELTDETATLSKHGHRHTLRIPFVTEEDLGNYTCRAENKIGFFSRELEVSGRTAPLHDGLDALQPSRSFLCQQSSFTCYHFVHFASKLNSAAAKAAAAAISKKVPDVLKFGTFIVLWM